MSQETRKKTSKQTATSRSPAATKAKTKAPAKRASKAAAQAPSKSSSKLSTAKRPAARKAGPVKAAKPVAKTAKPAVDSAPVKARTDLVEGQTAPAFQLPGDGGQTVSLHDYAGRNVVLFFYPKADTPGCTREAMDFSRLAGEFKTLGTDVVGVSADTVKKQDSFKNKHKLTTPLASDENKEMLGAYGAWGEKSMYGRSFMGVLRTTVLIGRNGKIVRIWRHVKVDGHADAVLEAVRSL